MASNELPKGLDALFTMADDMADGLALDATMAQPLAVLQNTEVAVRASLLAAQTAQNDYYAARGAKPALSSAANVADSNAKNFIGLARNILRVFLGNAWSDAWLPTGFPNNSLAVPATVQERQALLQSLQAYFVANPARENGALNVNDTKAGQLFTALSNARAALNAHHIVLGQKKAARDAAVAALRKRMSGLIAELTQLLPADDPRWYGFGLNPPAAPDTPEIPDLLVLTPGGAGIIFADWLDAPRANRYRVWHQIVGTDLEFVATQTVNDSDATLTGLPSGATVRVQITAANDAGESQPGSFAEVVVG